MPILNWIYDIIERAVIAAESYLEGFFPLAYFDVIRERMKTAGNMAVAACFPILSPVRLRNGT
jgi:hypothetical protein